MPDFTPDTPVVIDGGAAEPRRATIVHKMEDCPDCGRDRYHCRFADNGEDVAVCVPCIRRLN